jgi:two-component system, cell cycle sensor histidine kinase DivJ
LADTSSSSTTPEAAAAPREVTGWHAAWALAVVLAGVVLVIAAPGAPWTAWCALLLGLAPAGLAVLLVRRDSPGRRLIVLASWAIAAVLASGLTGGVVGPLAVWCVTPLAVAAVLGGGRPLAAGASLSLGAFAMVGLAQAVGWVAPAPARAASFDLGLLGVSTTCVGLAAALVMLRRRLNQRNEAQGAVNAELHALLMRQPHLIVVLDTAGRASAAYGSPPPGVSADHLFADGLAALVSPDRKDDLAGTLSAARQDGEGALRFQLAGGDNVWLDLSLRRLDEARLIATLSDATAGQRREAALETARAVAEALNIGKSRFLANMSHELRTPLNAIMGFSDIMRQKIFGSLPGKYVEYADLIHDAGSHLLDLINDVLDMSKIEAARYELSLERLDAREPVQAALRLMRLQADDVGVQLRGVLPSQPLEADADRRALKQIALNLISNALKFTPRGGLVSVSMRASAGMLDLTVADTGVGISRADLERLGTPFEQAGDLTQQAQGTGLGLSLVRAFSELHGGEMSIESQLGAGTAVTVRLPVLAPPDDAAAPPAPPTAGAQVIAFNPQR